MPIRTTRFAAAGRLTAWHAAAFYLAAAIWWTWPLAPVISKSIAWDLGDPMLVAWVMGWVSDSILALGRGDAARFLQLWDAPIFYPQPLTLAYSDHLIAQSLFTLPLYAVTGNVILCYNAALLASFVLSGLGMFLLTRDLTGSVAAGVLTGAVYAFTPYRVDQMSHLAILWSQWMPFALYGLRRYFAVADTGGARGRIRPLVWGALALVAHNLSSGYLMLFFAPFAVAYVLGEMWGRGLLRRARVWLELGGAGLLTACLTLPFLLPYIAVSETVGHRAYETIREFSADVYAYATAPGYVRWLADRLSYMREAPENSVFPGVVATLLTAAALLTLAVQRWRAWRDSPARDGWRTAIAIVFVAITAVSAGMAIWIMLTGGRIVVIGGQEVRLRNLARFTLYGAVAFTMAAVVSARVRDALRGTPGSLLAGALAAAFAAFLFSLGPRMETMNEFIGTGPYTLLLRGVPGFEGLRVPSRYAMVVIMWMAVAAAYAAAPLARRGGWGLALVALLSVGAVVESRPAPFDIDAPLYEPDVAPITMTHRLRLAEPLYQKLGELPRGVLLELPWGTTGWDLQYMHAQRRHGWPLVNGFSGHYPDTYMRTTMIKDALTSPERGWWALERSGASHVIVHEWAFASIERGKRVSQWLRENGAVEVAATENDVLFRLPGGITHR